MQILVTNCDFGNLWFMISTPISRPEFVKFVFLVITCVLGPGSVCTGLVFFSPLLVVIVKEINSQIGFGVTFEFCNCMNKKCYNRADKLSII